MNFVSSASITTIRSRASVYGRPMQFSATIGLEQINKRARGITGTIERFYGFDVGPPALRRRDDARRVGISDDNNSNQAGTVTRRRLEQCDREREHAVPHPRPDARTAQRSRQTITHDAKGHPSIPACDATPAATALRIEWGFESKLNLSDTD